MLTKGEIIQLSMNRACTLTAMDYSRPFQGGGRGIICLSCIPIEVSSVVNTEGKGPLVLYTGRGRWFPMVLFFFPPWMERKRSELLYLG